MAATPDPDFVPARWARWPDAELLCALALRDEEALRELFRRYAPAVYAQCRRHLSDPSDLDDVFQATFVVLARKAGTLAHPERLCSWLCGVADRIARKARVRNAKRNAAERPLETADEPTTTDPTQPPAGRGGREVTGGAGPAADRAPRWSRPPAGTR